MLCAETVLVEVENTAVDNYYYSHYNIAHYQSEDGQDFLLVGKQNHPGPHRCCLFAMHLAGVLKLGKTTCRRVLDFQVLDLGPSLRCEGTSWNCV